MSKNESDSVEVMVAPSVRICDSALREGAFCSKPISVFGNRKGACYRFEHIFFLKFSPSPFTNLSKYVMIMKNKTQLKVVSLKERRRNMDISTVLIYIKDLIATIMVLLTMVSPAFGNNGAAYEALNPDELVASFVVVSDIHVETNQPEAYNYLNEVLEGIKAGENVDAVIYTGDNVMNGQDLENIFFYSAVRSVMPSENNFVLAGNHDLGNSAGDYEQLLSNYITNNKLFLGEDVGKGYYYRVVNGCYIICLI